jgi:hypothetical protein
VPPRELNGPRTPGRAGRKQGSKSSPTEERETLTTVYRAAGSSSSALFSFTGGCATAEGPVASATSLDLARPCRQPVHPAASTPQTRSPAQSRCQHGHHESNV